MRSGATGLVTVLMTFLVLSSVPVPSSVPRLALVLPVQARLAAESSAQSASVRPRAAAPTPGISESLAAERDARISDLRYELWFEVPSEPAAPVNGRAVMRFTLTDRTKPLAIDFEPAATHTRRVRSNGVDARHTTTNGHIVVSAAGLRDGANEIEVEFQAGDASLNRNADFLYTLFVPARAHLAFPCFDQPSLKARYSLNVSIPAAWQVVANGSEAGRELSGDRVAVRFSETKPLPTYLFAFAAGRFSVETAERGGRTFRMFHRETDRAKVLRNADVIFDLHARAIAWLQEYTGIPYPWVKFEFVLIPSFQFGGMEHAGAILYNASGLMLEESATVNQQLGRASTIAHETAHMWFGDLVTMKWFDDVWMKEVFANFMAAKIVNPSFPQINHELRFLLAHYPAAYNVDGTPGANAIRQRLANLNEAGTLYGAIIYQKAPIVMRNLEMLVGVERFQDGLREYLRRYSFGNAAWADLVSILDARTDEDLREWSRAWVDEPGRPTIRPEITFSGDVLGRVAFTQVDPRRRSLVWNQRLSVTLGYADRQITLPVHLSSRRAVVSEAAGLPRPLYILPNGGGVAYGQVELDPASRAHLLQHLPDMPDAVGRGSAWVTLWDELLRGAVEPRALLDIALEALPHESDELNVQQVLSYTRKIYWQFITPAERLAVAPRVEATLRQGTATAGTQSLKSAYFRAYRDTTLTPGGVAWLERVWAREEAVPGLSFSEVDEIAMALEIAVREVRDWKAVLERQLARTENPDRNARLAFVMPALDADADVRDRFFAALSNPTNRAHEPWVLEGVTYLHHPLRASSSVRYVGRSLQMLREIQQTGDIFFPKNWMDATLSGHSSPAAAGIVRTFLGTLPASYPSRLRMTIEASAHELFVASRQAR